MTQRVQADFTYYLKPYQQLQLPASAAVGNFIFVKQGVNLGVVTDHSTVIMEAGDTQNYYEEFKEVVISNGNSFGQQITLTIGFGDYKRNVVSGHVTAISGLIRNDGSVQNDDRIKENVDINITDTGGFSWTKNQSLAGPNATAFNLMWGGHYDPFKNQFLVIGRRASDNKIVTAIADPKTATVGATSGDYGDGVANYFATDPYRVYARGTNSNICHYVEYGENFALKKELTTFDNPLAADWRFYGCIYDYQSNETLLMFQSQANNSLWGVQIINSNSGIVKSQFALDSGLSGAFLGGFKTPDGRFLINTTSQKRYLDVSAKAMEVTTDYSTTQVSAYNIEQNLYFNFAYPTGNCEVRAIEDKDYQGYGFVSVGECLPFEIFNRDSIAKISADVTLTQQGDATVKIEGEVIKAIMELYAAKKGGAVPVDYLDYVYGIEGGGLNTYTGDESFKRAGVLDSFTLESPTKITLYFSKRLLEA